MALHHSTEYSVDGGAWILAYADEEAGPGKSLTPVGLLPGSYSVRLRITPLTGVGAAVISDPVVYIVAAGADAHQTQNVQYQSANGLSGYIATVVQNQVQTQSVQTELLFVGNSVESQSVQIQTVSAPNLNSTGVVTESQSIQTSNIVSSLIYYATVTNNQAAQTELAASDLNLSGTVSESQSVQTENVISSLLFSAVGVQNQTKQTSNENGTISAANVSPTFTQQPTFTSADPYNITFAYGTADADGDHYLREISTNSGSSFSMGTVADETPGSGKSVVVNVGGTGATAYDVIVRLTPLTGNVTPVYSSVVTMYTTCFAPSLSVAAGNAQNTLTWAAVTGALSYSAYWTSNGDTPSALQPTDSTHGKLTAISTGYIHTGLTNNTTYKYALVANNAGGDSDLSAVVSGTPSATAYPVTLANGNSITASVITNFVASKSGTSTVQQTAIDTFLWSSGTSASAVGAILSGALPSTWAYRLKFTSLTANSGTCYIPIMSAKPATGGASIATGFAATEKLRFSYSMNGGFISINILYKNAAGSYFGLLNTGLFTTTANTLGTSFNAGSSATNGFIAEVMKDGTNFKIRLLDSSGVAISGASGSIAISSVRNGSASDYISIGDNWTDDDAIGKGATVAITSITPW